jgi:Ser-tRNA(Ala) deacylase AlaX
MHVVCVDGAAQVDGVPVAQVFRHADGRVLHALPAVPADPSKVLLSVEWERRFDHMQQHTGTALHLDSLCFLCGGSINGKHHPLTPSINTRAAQHLISSLAMSRLNADTASWSLGKDVCTIGTVIHFLSSLCLLCSALVVLVLT